MDRTVTINQKTVQGVFPDLFLYYTTVISLCWLALLVLCILVQENGRIQRSDKRLLWLTYMLIGLSALAEWVSLGLYRENLAVLPRWILVVAKCVDYTLTPMAGATLVLQLGIRNRWRTALMALLGANALFQVAAAIGGWMVTLDEAGNYVHGPLYPVYSVVYLSVIVIVGIEIILYGRMFRRQNHISLAGIMLLVIAGVIIQEFTESECRTVYLALTLGAVLMYIHSTEYTQLKMDDFLKYQRSQINMDPMTGVGSRSSYVHDLKALDAPGSLPEDLVTFMIDINDLKSVNDTMGHEAGDELICGASACIVKAFGAKGKCYRTGGDEFVVLARLDRGEAEAINGRLEDACRGWRGNLVEGLRVSTGWACAADHPGLTCQQLISRADERMYEAKAAYYSQAGRDRRRRRVGYGLR